MGARLTRRVHFAFAATGPICAAPMADTTLMSIPGQVDPVPVARDITPREDGRVDLIGLPKDRIRELFAEAGLDAKQVVAFRAIAEEIEEGLSPDEK